MILIMFIFIFSIISIVMLTIANRVIGDENRINESQYCYTTVFVKGTTRGSVGIFVSNSMLEKMREKLKTRYSKF